MDDVMVRKNSPASPERNGGDPSNNSGRHDGKLKRGKRKLVLIIVGIVVLLALVLGGWWFVYRSDAGTRIDDSKYQAVFFTNGQVYFGKLQNLNGSYFKLTSVYYLQAPAAKDDSKNPQQTSNQQAADLQLIKLGSEIHGPDDEMIINKDQILFFENLKKDGKVTNSIDKYASTEKK